MSTGLSRIRDLSRLPRRLLGLTTWCSLGVTALCFAGGVAHKQAILKGDFQETISGNIRLSGHISAAPMAVPNGVGVSAPRPAGRKDSGTVIVGVSNGSLDGKQIKSLAISAGTDRSSSEVCLTVLTRDGIYWANNQYTLPSDIVAGDLVLLPYEKSRHLNVLASYADTEIAAMAANGPCDTPVKEVQLVGDVGADNTIVRLYVDSARATDVHISSTDHKRVRCKATRSGRFRYDHICTLEWPAIQGGKISLKVTRERFGRSLPDASVTVVRGAP